MPQLPSGQWSPTAYAAHLAEQLDVVRYAIGHIEQEGRTPNRGEMEAFEEFFRRTLADFEFLLESETGQGWTNLAAEAALAMAESAVMTGIGLEEPFHIILEDYPNAETAVMETWGDAQLPGQDRDFTHTPRIDRLLPPERPEPRPLMPPSDFEFLVEEAPEEWAVRVRRPGARTYQTWRRDDPALRRLLDNSVVAFRGDTETQIYGTGESAPAEPPTLEGLREQAASSALAPAEPAELPSGVQAQLDNVETSLRERGGPRRPASVAFVDFLADSRFQAVLETSEDLQNQVRRMVDLVDEDFWEESGDYKQALLEVSDLIDQAEPADTVSLQERLRASAGLLRDLMSRIEVLETRIDQAWRDESTHLRTLSDLNDVAASVSGWEDRGYVVSDLTSRIARVLDEMHPQVREIFEREPTFQGLEWARRRHPNGPPATPAAPAATPAAAPPHLRQYPLRRSPTEQAFFDQLVPELRRVLDNDPELTRTLRSRMGSAESPTENMQRFLADYFSMTVGHDEYLRLMEEDHNAPLRQLEAFRRGSDSGPLQRYFVIREPEGLVPVVRTNIGLWGGNKINLGNLENMAGESLQKMGGTNAALRALSESLDRENITVGGSPGAFNAGGLPTGHRSDAGKRVEDLPDYQGGHGPGHPTLHWFYARLGFDWRTGSRAPRSPWPRPLPTLEGVDRVAWNRRDFIGGAVNTKRQRIARKGAERAEATVGAEREKRWAEMRQRELEKMDPAARARHEAAQRGISGTQLPLPGMMPEGPAQAPEGYEPPPPPPPEVPAQQGAEGGPIRVQIGANNFLEYASPQQQRALLNSRMEDFRTNLTHGDGSRSGIVLHDLISQRRALRQHGPDAAPYLIDLDLAIDSGLTTLMEEGHPFYRDAYRRAVDAGVDIGGEATSQILLAEPDPITFGQENPGRRPETHQSPRAYQESLESDLEFFRERLFDYQDELPTLRNYRGPVSEIHSLLEDYEQVQEHWHLGMHPINTASAYAALQREHINERLRLLADVFPVQPEFPGLEPHERVESLTRRIHGLDVTRPHAELENLAEAMEARPPTLGSEAVSIEEAAQAINEIMSGREPSPPAPAVAEPASAPAPAAELPVAAAAPEGRTVEIDNNPWSGDRSFTISVPEAMEEARQHLELARTQHGRGSRWAARNLLLADGVLRALHPVVGQTGEMEELSSQYRDLLRQVSEEDLREVAAQYPAMEVPVREAIQGRQLTQHADVIERELQRLLREEPIITERSPETAERIAGLRESRQSLEDARGKLGRATPWLVGAALKGGVKPGVAQAEEMGVERPRVEARQEAPSPVEAPASQKPPRPLPATEPTPGTSVVPPAPPGPDAPPPPQPKAGTVEPARAYETPRAAKEAPAVRQAQSAYDAIQKKFPEALRSIEVEAAVRQGDKMMRKARTLEDAGKHAEALRYREAARLNFQSLERVAKLKGLTRTASRALGYASLPLIALDAYGMTKQAMEEGPAAVGRQVAEGMEEAGRGIGRVALPEKAEEALGLDEPGTLRGEEIREQRERAKRGIQEQEDDAEAREFFAAGGGLPPSASDILQERQEHWNLTDPEELARKRREAVQRAMAPKPNPNLTLPVQK